MREIPDTRMFNGKRFDIDTRHRWKYGAKRRAAALRKQGYDARVVRHSKGSSSWLVYRKYGGRPKKDTKEPSGVRGLLYRRYRWR